MSDFFEGGPVIDLDTLIQDLSLLRARHGGRTPVQVWNVSEGRHNIHRPAVAFMNTKRSTFFDVRYDSAEEKGMLVIRIK